MTGGVVIMPSCALVNIPWELGEKIFSQIRSSNIPSDEEIERRVREIELRVMREEENERQRVTER